MVLFRKKRRIYQGQVLPPPHLRKGPAENQRDAVYLRTAIELVTSIVEMIGESKLGAGQENQILAQRNILDIGCGPVRLLTGLLALDIPFGTYVGMDVQRAPIRWATRNFRDKNTRFYCMNLKNERYNPTGQRLSDFSLPEPDAAFDLVVLRSVFTHMRLREMETYLKEVRRVLHPRGHAYISVFAEDDVPLEEENPLHYRGEKGRQGPLHRVRINRQYFEQKIRDAGLCVKSFCPNVLNQPTYILTIKNR